MIRCRQKDYREMASRTLSGVADNNGLGHGHHEWNNDITLRQGIEGRESVTERGRREGGRERDTKWKRVRKIIVLRSRKQKVKGKNCKKA